MADTAYDRFVADLADWHVRANGSAARAKCPAHDGQSNDSLALKRVEGQVLLHCHGGCHVDDVLGALNKTRRDLYDNPRGDTYQYTDRGGTVLRTVTRTPDKEFKQYGQTKGTSTLYRLPRVVQAVENKTVVFLVEGEKDVHALETLGVVATTAPMGAANFNKVDPAPLAGAHVVAIPDQDEGGAKWLAQVREHVEPIAATFQVKAPKVGKDAADHIAAGRGLPELVPVELEPATPAVRVATEGWALVNTPDPDYDWLIPNLLERGDRLLLTGGEGHGKSTLLRQIGIQASCGIHPFRQGVLFDPLRVLMVDAENSARPTRRALRPLLLAAGDRYQHLFHIDTHPEGLDLYTDRADGEWLESLVAGTRPDLLIIGPLYKLHFGDPTEERPAKVVASWLDKIRTQYGCGLILEAHSPHSENKRGAKRPTRPYGASLWLRWPEFGLHLGERGALTHWRGARDERDWPALLQRGGEWPWTPVDRPRDDLWGRIQQYCVEAGDRLSYRDLAELTGAGLGSVKRAVDEHRDAWNALGGDHS